MALWQLSAKCGKTGETEPSTLWQGNKGRQREKVALEPPCSIPDDGLSMACSLCEQT